MLWQYSEFMTMQQGDVILRQTPNDGDICVSGGLVDMDGGLCTAAYLSLFGGNFSDDGSQDNPTGWWGNVLETDPSFQMVSRTQNLLQGIPATSSNLVRIQDAATADLDWLTDVMAASSVEVTVTMPDRSHIQITANINAEGEPQRFQFLANWSDSIDANSADGR